MKQKCSRRVKCTGTGATGAARAGASDALIVRGQCRGSTVPYQHRCANKLVFKVRFRVKLKLTATLAWKLYIETMQTSRKSLL